MLDEDGRVIGVRVDSNDDSGFWLEVLFPKTSQTKDTVMKEDGDDDEDDDEKDDDEDDDEKDDDEKDDDEDGDVGAKTISKLRLLGEKHGVKMTSKDMLEHNDEMLQEYTMDFVTNALCYAMHARRKVLTKADALAAEKRMEEKKRMSPEKRARIEAELIERERNIAAQESLLAAELIEKGKKLD